MLQLTAIGRLTKDPETKQNKSGKEFIVFTLAVNKSYGENQTTTYVSCCAGGALYNPLSKAKKGSLLSITGDLTTELYQKNDGSTGENIKCFISSFYYIPIGDGKKKDGQNNSHNAPNTQNRAQNSHDPAPYNPQQYQQQYRPQYQNGSNAPQSNQQYQNNSRSYQNPQQYAPPQNQDMPDDYGEYSMSDEDLPF